MTIQIVNKQMFEWEIPEELVKLKEEKNIDIQTLVDNYFDPNGISVDQITDDWYEYAGEV